MRKAIAIFTIAAAAGLATLPASAATEADCTAMWNRADADKNGSLSKEESLRYGALMRISNRPMEAGDTLSRQQFLDACKADAFADPRPNDAGAPLKGANSFTEGQARDRALARGLTNVGELRKDDDGIWRGTAAQDGKHVQVAVDYKGNVVTSTRP